MIGWNTKFLLESLDQSSQMANLSIGEPSSLAIANQTDSNRSLVVVLAGFAHDVSAWKLLIPSITDMDLAISQTVSVADEEVITKSLISPPEVPAMNRLGGTEGFTQMMNHDSPPAISIQGVFEHEDWVFSRPVLKISKACQRKARGGCWGSQIQKNDDRGHGSEETTQNDLGSSRNRGL